MTFLALSTTSTARRPHRSLGDGGNGGSTERSSETVAVSTSGLPAPDSGTGSSYDSPESYSESDVCVVSTVPVMM